MLVDDFIQRFPDRLEAYPRDPTKAAEPYPTPRNSTVKLLAATESVSASKHVRRLLVNGCVGDGAGAEFTAFLETQALPDPEDVLADPQALRLPRRGDLAVAIVRSILARVETDNSIDRCEPAATCSSTPTARTGSGDGRLRPLWKSNGWLRQSLNGLSESTSHGTSGDRSSVTPSITAVKSAAISSGLRFSGPNSRYSLRSASQPISTRSYALAKVRSTVVKGPLRHSRAKSKSLAAIEK